VKRCWTNWGQVFLHPTSYDLTPIKSTRVKRELLEACNGKRIDHPDFIYPTDIFSSEPAILKMCCQCGSEMIDCATERLSLISTNNSLCLYDPKHQLWQCHESMKPQYGKKNLTINLCIFYMCYLIKSFATSTKMDAASAIIKHFSTLVDPI
jgi:hypothetical protein